jgi:hypothetical protein
LLVDGRNELRSLWLGSRDEAAGGYGSRLWPIPLPGLRPPV